MIALQKHASTLLLSILLSYQQTSFATEVPLRLGAIRLGAPISSRLITPEETLQSTANEVLSIVALSDNTKREISLDLLPNEWVDSLQVNAMLYRKRVMIISLTLTGHPFALVEKVLLKKFGKANEHKASKITIDGCPSYLLRSWRSTGRGLYLYHEIGSSEIKIDVRDDLLYHKFDLDEAIPHERELCLEF